MPGPSLVVWGGGSTRSASGRHAEGATVVAWYGAEQADLVAAGVPFRTAEDVVGASGLATAEAAARDWARVWARLPLLEGRSFRDLVPWRGHSLLWTAEDFLRTSTAGPRCARTVELCHRLLEALKPEEMDACGLSAADAALLARTATACGVLYHGQPVSTGPLPRAPATSRKGALRRALSVFALRRGGFLEALDGPSRLPLLLLLAAPSQDADSLQTLLNPAAQGGFRAVLIDLTDLARFETRQARRSAKASNDLLRERLADLRGTPALAASYVHRGVGFADLAASDLEVILLGRMPATVRKLECVLEMITFARPALVLTVAPERDLHRTIGTAASVAEVPWVRLRLDATEPDEAERADGGPHPLASLVLAPGDDPADLLARLREAASVRGGAQ